MPTVEDESDLNRASSGVGVDHGSVLENLDPSVCDEAASGVSGHLRIVSPGRRLDRGARTRRTRRPRPRRRRPAWPTPASHRELNEFSPPILTRLLERPKTND